MAKPHSFTGYGQRHVYDFPDDYARQKTGTRYFALFSISPVFSSINNYSSTAFSSQQTSPLSFRIFFPIRNGSAWNQSPL